MGYGPAVLRRGAALAADGMNIQYPPFAARKNLNVATLPMIVWYQSPDNPTTRPHQMRLYKTGPAFGLSKTIRDVTQDASGVLPFCKVLVFSTRDNVLVATTVSDANGNYSVTVPE